MQRLLNKQKKINKLKSYLKITKVNYSKQYHNSQVISPMIKNKKNEYFEYYYIFYYVI